MVLYKGDGRTADTRTLDMLIAACSGGITRGDKEDRPELLTIAAKATKPKPKPRGTWAAWRTTGGASDGIRRPTRQPP